jgi:hypothetical protein
VQRRDSVRLGRVGNGETLGLVAGLSAGNGASERLECPVALDSRQQRREVGDA